MTISALNVVAALMNLALNGLLIPGWGIAGAAVATMIAQGWRLAMMWRASQRAYPLSLAYGKLAAVLIGMVNLFVLGQAFSPWGWTTATIGQSALVAASPLLLWIFPRVRRGHWRAELR